MNSNTFLILDDIEVNRTVLRCMLSSIYKYSIIVEASSGMECIKLYDELLSSFYHIDCVFIDYLLPDMDGVEVMKQLRELHYDGPAIMITASSDKIVKSLEDTKLFCKVIQKPLNMMKMKQIIDDRLSCHKKYNDSCEKLK